MADGPETPTPTAKAFHHMIHTEAGIRMAKAVEKMVHDSSPHDPAFEEEMHRFLELFLRFAEDSKGPVEWEKVQSPKDDMLMPYESLKPCPAPSNELLNKLAVLKLNGGLGTSMGCVGPKSIIEVRGGMTFLDLIVRQIEALNKATGAHVPLILMNSFNTHEDTQKIIGKYASLKDVQIHTFNQSCFPRFYKDTLLPCPDKKDSPEGCWYPPGHGDVYASLKASGLLKRLIDEGKEWLFISNGDNLGATVDPTLLQYLDSVKGECEYLMEVTEKTKADVKGGTLIDYEGQCKLLELAQVPKDHVNDFTSIKKFRVFNTNNMWVNLQAVMRKLESHDLHMEIIVNQKVYNNQKVIQLEEAAGAAVGSFKGSRGVIVPRSRFLPVKTTSDLLLVQSNLYKLQEARLVMNPARLFGAAPLIKLGPEFTKVGDFQSRFKNIPDIMDLDHLTVSGDITFGAGVSLRGTVIIIANKGDHIDIPDGSILENKIVSGNLRLLDH